MVDVFGGRLEAVPWLCYARRSELGRTCAKRVRHMESGNTRAEYGVRYNARCEGPNDRGRNSDADVEELNTSALR